MHATRAIKRTAHCQLIARRVCHLSSQRHDILAARPKNCAEPKNRRLGEQLADTLLSVHMFDLISGTWRSWRDSSNPGLGTAIIDVDAAGMDATHGTS